VASVSSYCQKLWRARLEESGEFGFFVRHADEAADALKHTPNKTVDTFLEQTNKLASNAPNSAVHVAGQGSTIRKFNLRPGTDPKWGLTKQHLNKHFFGDSKFALKKIDPGGTADKWKQHLAELYNGPVSGTTSNGMLDIFRTFPRADGSGTFKMGIRLFDRGDGTFDLVTVLTKQ
jgi:hypothetical protein